MGFYRSCLITTDMNIEELKGIKNNPEKQKILTNLFRLSLVNKNVDCLNNLLLESTNFLEEIDIDISVGLLIATSHIKCDTILRKKFFDEFQKSLLKKYSPDETKKILIGL